MTAITTVTTIRIAALAVNARQPDSPLSLRVSYATA
jgi:hypothetical protein